MRVAALLALTVATAGHAQQPAADHLRTLLARDDAMAVVEAARAQPDDARELLRRLLVEAGTARGAVSDSALELARRLGGAYGAAWADSFPLEQVDRFSRLTRLQRTAKIAADSMRWRANATLGRDGPAAALPLWREAVRRSTAIADTLGIAPALANLGAGFYRLAEFDSADVHLGRARALAAAIGDRRTMANAVSVLGSIAKDVGDLPRAQALYAQALDVHSRIGDVSGSAADRNNLGLVAEALGDVAAARRHYEDALSVTRRYGLWEWEAAALINLGNLASADGEYAVATRRYGDALALYRSHAADADAALVLQNLGRVALRRGDYPAARRSLTQALAIFARAGTVTDLVLVRSDLASVAAGAGDFRDALAQLGRAEALLPRAADDAALAAEIALARADVSAQLNMLPAAEREYARAEALYRRADDRRGQAEARTGQALVVAQRRQYARALELLRSAARTHAESGDRRPAALAQLMIGYVLREQGDLAVARRMLESAIDSLRALGDVAGEAAALSALGDVELDARLPVSAEASYRRGLAALGSRTAPGISWQLRSGMGRALRVRGALAEATIELRTAIDDIERMAGVLPLEDRRTAFLADKWEPYVQLAMIERMRGNLVAAFETSERMRARQMLDILARGRVSPPVRGDAALVDRAQDLQRRIAELTARLEGDDQQTTALRGPDLDGTQSAVIREALARAQDEYTVLLLELRESVSAYGQIVRGVVVSWKETAARLAPDEALLEYLVFDSAAVVFVVTADTLRVIDLDVGRQALESRVAFARGTMVRPAARSPSLTGSPWRAPLRRLYRDLVAPVEASGALDSVRRLIIVPNAELHYLPFAPLIRGGGSRPGERDEFLIERYEIAYTPSASVWVRLGDRPMTPSGRVLALAPRPDALPGSRDEVEAIRSLYGRDATVLTGAAASEPAFRSAAPGYDVVHLATYGVLNKHNPLFSFVSLNPAGDADGRLEVHEILGLGLNARLLVLSACQTALGSGIVSDVPAGDDWVGLVRAFLGVGAANVVATLWPIEDRSTARLMAALHREIRSGHPEAAALAVAQRTMLRNPATADPFYWAGVVLVGGR